MQRHALKRAWLFRILASLIPVLYMEGVHLVNGAPFAWPGFLARWTFVFCILLLAQLPLAIQTVEDRRRQLWLIGISTSFAILSGLAYALSGSTALAWTAAACLFSILLVLDSSLAPGKGRWMKWILRSLIALPAGISLAAAAQIEAHFAEEEFFAAVQTLALVLFWILLLFAHTLWGKTGSAPPEKKAILPGKMNLAPIALPLVAIPLTLTGLFFILQAYQNSFYPSQAPEYPGITSNTPFICGEISPAPEVYAGKDLHQQILALVEANPHRGSPEYGMLALGTGEQRWVDRFRQSLLDEAKAGLYTQPAHSVKFIQYEAALRAYYFSTMKAAFPGLFDPSEDQELRQWFAAINRRALTVEWVDWMYSLAFGFWPEGPYENQENGAGLLAVLEAQGLAEPALSEQNRAYLSRNPRGWLERFRNTDDAVVYQPEWITNAFFQNLYSQDAPEWQVRHSFEWLLLQAVPDGSLLRYNHPGAISLADSAYLGARLLHDGQYIWLAGKSLDYLAAHEGFLFAQPGIEHPVGLTGHSPTQGSCLLYGDSGLPNQVGPLAPDKIVMRDGWSDDSNYLLLNLRFTGWHRYKGTNTITSLYQAGPLLVEQFEGKPVSWLPVGRSQFRDKRIPRENLNGLVVERTGLSAVLYTLTGIGGPWAQDPPYYASVEEFSTGAEYDMASTVVKDWRGWDHKRRIYLYHNGPVVIFDLAVGQAGREGALIWHVPAGGPVQNNRIQIRSGENPAEMVLLPVEIESIQAVGEVSSGETAGQKIQIGAKGRLSLVTVFLTGSMVGAETEIIQGIDGLRLSITQAEQQILLPFDQEPAG